MHLLAGLHTDPERETYQIAKSVIVKLDNSKTAKGSKTRVA